MSQNRLLSSGVMVARGSMLPIVRVPSRCITRFVVAGSIIFLMILREELHKLARLFMSTAPSTQALAGPTGVESPETDTTRQISFSARSWRSGPGCGTDGKREWIDVRHFIARSVILVKELDGVWRLHIRCCANVGKSTPRVADGTSFKHNLSTIEVSVRCGTGLGHARRDRRANGGLRR